MNIEEQKEVLRLEKLANILHNCERQSSTMRYNWAMELRSQARAIRNITNKKPLNPCGWGRFKTQERNVR